LTTSNNNNNKNLYETDEYVVKTGNYEDFKQEVYLVLNKITGIVEYGTPVLPQAMSAADQFQEHLVEMRGEVRPSLSVASDEEQTH